MAGQDDEFQPGENATPIQSSGHTSQEEQVQDLTWALLDELITDDQMALLDQLLRDSATARDTYLRCVQLHAELSRNFATSADAVDPSPQKKPPVLGFLDSGVMPLELQSPPAEALPTD